MRSPIVYTDTLVEIGPNRATLWLSELTEEQRDIFLQGYKKGEKVGSERGATVLVVVVSLVAIVISIVTLW